ncbi:hypothetical protein BDN72DRAFT_944079 [Pluteus cervinus]|uniref:Uncharacterized protein n=1 Tax=Pluteus cervinus TaxID=181527 RepID=A0ACD3A2Z7_9AGAR|nr:hypothetical protein BDN72DRAFT_944079 [Pluteus cervinus]
MIPSLLWLVPCSLAYTAWAQTNAECTNLPAAQWTFNSLGQSPCDVAAALGGVCNAGAYSIPPLAATQIYTGPTLALANTCRCSTAFYSMLSACAFCQSGTYEPVVFRWGLYSFNCTTNDGIGFPSPIPQGFAVPAYAYIDVTNPANGGTFNLTLAQADTSPESSAAPKPTASFPTTTGSVPTNVPSIHSTSSKPNAGAIAGGVIGGIVILVLAGVGFFVWRKKKNTSSSMVQPASNVVQPDLTGGSYTAPISYTSTSPFSPGFPAGNSGTGTRVYDPSDPSTFPISPVQSSITGLSGYNGGSTVEHQNLLAPSLIGSTGTKRNYTGVPEV